MVVTEMDDARCDWCDRPFRVRTTGGHAQRFCGIGCRRSYDAAGRRFIAEAIADGTLTPAALKSGYIATRALLLAGISPAPIDAARPPVAAAPPESAVELAVELLQDLIVAAPDSEWFAALPVELLDRLVAWFDAGAG
jgi:hypothetical protein